MVLVAENLSAIVGDSRDMGLIPGLGGSPEDPMNRGNWWATVHGVT